MTEATLAVTAGSGTLLHTNTRVISSNTVHDEFTLPGEFPYPTYTVVAAGVAWTTTQRDLIQIMAGSTNNVRIRRIRITQVAAASAVGTRSLQIFRLTTAGTGGTSITPRPFDTSAAAAGATAMTKPTSNGTQGVQLWQQASWFGIVATPVAGAGFEWVQNPNSQPLIIPAGTTNGIALTNAATESALTVDITVEFVETSFV